MTDLPLVHPPNCGCRDCRGRRLISGTSPSPTLRDFALDLGLAGVENRDQKHVDKPLEEKP